MKVVLFSLSLLLAVSAFACGDDNQYFVEGVLVASMLIICFCALVIPVSTMLLNRLITKAEIRILSILVFAGIGLALGMLFWRFSAVNTVLGILLAVFVMALPSCVLLLKSVKHTCK